MNPSRRARLREDLRADTARFAALAERHGTPLLGLQPHLVARRYSEMAARLPGFHLHYRDELTPSGFSSPRALPATIGDRVGGMAHHDD
jgi:ornithine decarboxylase